MRLHLNENPYDFPYFLKRKILKIKWNIYEEKEKVKHLISEYEGFPPSWILPGNGADEIIFLIMLAFDKNIITNFPSFSGYKDFSRILGRELVEIPLDENFDIDEKNILRFKDGILFIANPNNPTSNLFSKEKILKIIENFKGIIAIDETYIDFSGEKSFKEFLRNYKNLIIIKSFSKSFSFSGIRFGYAISNPEIIKKLKEKALPYSVNSIALNCAEYVFKNIEIFEKRIKKIIEEREKMLKILKKEKTFVLPSKTNFLFIKVKNEKIFNDLKRNGILFKVFDLKDNGKFLRISIGRKNGNEKILKIIRRWAK